MGNKKFLISGILIILAIFLLAIFAMLQIKNKIPNVCQRDIYSIISYTEGYNPSDRNHAEVIKTQDDIDKLIGILKKDDLKKLNIKQHDYLFYFLEPQNGCDRTKRINCVELDNKSITLKLDEYENNPTCSIIFRDVIVIELKKDMYNKNTKIIIEKGD